MEEEREWRTERERNERTSGWVKALLDQVQGKSFTLEVVNAQSSHVCMYPDAHSLCIDSCMREWSDGSCYLLYARNNNQKNPIIQWFIAPINNSPKQDNHQSFSHWKINQFLSPKFKTIFFSVDIPDIISFIIFIYLLLWNLKRRASFCSLVLRNWGFSNRFPGSVRQQPPRTTHQPVGESFPLWPVVAKGYHPVPSAVWLKPWIDSIAVAGRGFKILSVALKWALIRKIIIIIILKKSWLCQASSIYRNRHIQWFDQLFVTCESPSCFGSKNWITGIPLYYNPLLVLQVWKHVPLYS